jgi:hypothetical protein
MYRLEIAGALQGNYMTAAEAMAQVEKWARPFGHRWIIHSPNGEVFAQG